MTKEYRNERIKRLEAEMDELRDMLQTATERNEVLQDEIKTLKAVPYQKPFDVVWEPGMFGCLYETEDLGEGETIEDILKWFVIAPYEDGQLKLFYLEGGYDELTDCFEEPDIVFDEDGLYIDNNIEISYQLVAAGWAKGFNNFQKLVKENDATRGKLLWKKERVF